MTKKRREIRLELIVQCLKANENFTIRELRERLVKLGDVRTISVIRKKIVDLHNEGAATRIPGGTATYRCNKMQLATILEISKRPIKSKAKTKPKAKNIKSMDWLGAKIIGYPGETILMMGCDK